MMWRDTAKRSIPPIFVFYVLTTMTRNYYRETGVQRQCQRAKRFAVIIMGRDKGYDEGRRKMLQKRGKKVSRNFEKGVDKVLRVWYSI